MATARRSWTNARKKRVNEWITEVLPLLNLNDWTLQVGWNGHEFTHPQNGEAREADACMEPLPNSRHCTLYISNEFLEFAPERQQHVLVHELCHLFLFSLTEVASGVFSSALEENKIACAIAEKTFDISVESTTDALADAFVKFLPLLNLDS